MTRTVDAHVHLWNRAEDPQEWIDPESMGPIDRDFGVLDLVDMLRETDIDRAVVVQSSHSLNETRHLLEMSQTGPIAGVVGWIDLTGDVARQLDDLQSGPGGDQLCGIRHLTHIDPDPAWLGRPDVTRGLEAFAGTGLTVDLVLRPWQLAATTDIIDAHPGITFVLDHLGSPPMGENLAAWKHDLSQLSDRPNVVAKLSGIMTTLPDAQQPGEDLEQVLAVALRSFGPARLLYGSDYPLVRLAGGADEWVGVVRELLSPLSATERDLIFGASCTAVYGLGEQA